MILMLLVTLISIYVNIFVFQALFLFVRLQMYINDLFSYVGPEMSSTMSTEYR